MAEREGWRRYPWLIVALIGFQGLNTAVMSVHEILTEHGSRVDPEYVFAALGALECLAVVPLSFWARRATRERRETSGAKPQ